MQEEIHMKLKQELISIFQSTSLVFNTVALFPCPLRGSARHIFLVNRRSAF